MKGESKYGPVDTIRFPANYPVGIMIHGLPTELADYSSVELSATYVRLPNDTSWEAYAIGLLWTHKDTVKSITALHQLLQQKGYPGGRTALYSMSNLLAAAEALRIYAPSKKTRTPHKGFRTGKGSVEAIDEQDKL